ncbi:hypothetical protein Dfri01_44120 [Dyadobacter frigoris]|nr:hypothetical protein Dfri01_44120 [Dyadobacter frigoris]
MDYRKNPRWGIDSILITGYFLSVISSPSDTIKHEGFKIIDDFIRQNNFRYTVIRKWTEEEQYVTAAKIQHIKYDPNTIKWKVGFEQ